VTKSDRAQLGEEPVMIFKTIRIRILSLQSIEKKVAPLFVNGASFLKILKKAQE
jgi:hypothetical protein